MPPKARPKAVKAPKAPKAVKAVKGKASPADKDKRPSVPNAVSTAYGAPGNVQRPLHQEAKPNGNMLSLMQTMVEEDTMSEMGTSQIDSGTEADDYEEDYRRESVANVQQKQSATRIREPERLVQQKVDDRIILDAPRTDLDDIKPQFSKQKVAVGPDQTASPFSAVAKKIRNLWRSPAPKNQTSFMTEDRIASEARITRPRKGLVRRLIDTKEKVVNTWTDYTESTIIKTLLFAFKFFFVALVFLLIFQAIQPTFPESLPVTETIASLKDRVAAPVHSLFDKISSATHQNPTHVPGELDLSQLKSLKDSTSAQFKHLKTRLDNIEATYNRLAKKAKSPQIPARKINLFATGSGLTVDPYLTSPTRARAVASRNLVTKWFTRWRGWPESIHHGPMAAFTPWEDMGDCWCTPDSDGSAQIVVNLAQPVIPKELVVEHVSKHTTLQAGSAPKDIELWARIKNSKRRDAVVRGALQYGIHQNPLNERDDRLKSLDASWIRIGHWRYNIDAASNIQTFDIQVPLEEFGTPLVSLAFRASNNWGPVKYVCLYRLKLHGLVADTKIELDGIGY